MVKWRSSPASNGMFQVRVLVEAISLVIGRASRWAPGVGWKPIGGESPLRVRLPLLPLQWSVEEEHDDGISRSTG